VEFVPQGAAALVPYAGQRCQGVALRVVDRERFDASLLGAALVQALHRLWPERFHAERTLGMVGSAQALQQLRDGVPPGDARQRWEAGWGGFMRRRAAALLYETDGEGSAALPEAAASAPRP
jgi:uncharacterized protein YbbC (DUF1343 family)